MKEEKQDDETLAMIALARRSLETRAHEDDIKRTLIATYGCTPQAAKKFIRLARAEILADTMRDSEEHLADAFSFYLGIVRDRKAKVTERLKAQQRIDSLLAQEAYRRLDDNAQDRKETAELKKRMELLTSYLLPLNLTEQHYPVEEHARVAAEILIQNGLARLSTTPSESPRT
jgi:hypothetical protein